MLNGPKGRELITGNFIPPQEPLRSPLTNNLVGNKAEVPLGTKTQRCEHVYCLEFLILQKMIPVKFTENLLTRTSIRPASETNIQTLL